MKFDFITVNGAAVNEMFFKYYAEKARNEVILNNLRNNEKFDLNAAAERMSQLIRYDYAMLNGCDFIEQKEDFFNFISDEFKEENKSRSITQTAGGTVYGVEQFTFENYLDYLRENRRVEIRSYLNARFDFDNSNLLEYFYSANRNADPLFKEADGEFKPLDSVKAKVRFLFEKDTAHKYIEGAVLKQNFVCDNILLVQTLREIFSENIKETEAAK